MNAASGNAPAVRRPDGVDTPLLPPSAMIDERGFTLVELMFVVVIIGILASVAITTYFRYTNRTRMAEVVLAASACRSPISEVFHLGNTAPDPGGWGCESTNSSRYVQSVSVDGNGKVVVIAQNFDDSDIDGMQLTLIPLIDGVVASGATDIGKPVTAWRCGSSSDGTTVPERYLPSSCR